MTQLGTAGVRMVALRVRGRPTRASRRTWPAIPGAVLVALALLVAVTPATGQEARSTSVLRVGPDRLLSGDEPGLTHVEPHVAVNPSAPEQTVAASIVFRDGRATSEILVSHDGELWERTRFPACGLDPWVAWGSGENVYFSCLAESEGPVGVLVFRSTDAGRSWSAPVAPRHGGGGSFDHTSMAAVPRPDSGDVIYLAGMQGIAPEDGPPLAAPFVAVSRNGGRSFGEPRRIVWSNVMSNTLNAVVPARDWMGVAFLDFSVDGRRPIENRRLWWVGSRDEARSFSMPHLVADATAATTIPVMGAGVGDGDYGLLALAYDNVIDDRQGVYFVRSTDRGVTWSEPLPISVFDPDSGRAENPMTAVDADGTVGVAWYERPAGGAPGCWELRFTASTDAGRTFLPAVTVSGQSFCARPDEVDHARRWPAGGDYFGLVPLARGAFRIVWADSRTGIYQLRTADVRVKGRP